MSTFKVEASPPQGLLAFICPDCKVYEQGLFEGSSKLQNLRILKNIVGLPIDNGVNVLSRRCPNLQQLHIEFSIDEAADSFCLTLEITYPASNTSRLLSGPLLCTCTLKF